MRPSSELAYDLGRRSASIASTPPDDIELRALRAFKALCDLSGAELEASLAAHCGADAALRSRVERLIAADLAADSASSSGGGIVVGRGREVLVADLVADMVEGGEDAPKLPETLGPYRVLSVLGAGGMGVVYEAEQLHPRRRVALKSIHPGSLQHDGMAERFRREVEVMGALLHPAIPQVYEAGDDAGTVWMAMELIRGRRLDEHAKGRPLRERLELLVEVMDGVAHAHAAGVIHCDLKPSNILVTLEGQPKVLDFGLATHGLGHRARTVVGGGTLAYMAPEQRDPSGAFDQRVDVFALGVVMFQLLAGDLPKGRPTTGCGRDLDAIVTKAMAVAPADRYAGVRELGEDLRRYLALRPVSARRPTLIYRATLTLRRQHLLWRVVGVIALAALLVGMGALGWSAWQRQRQEERASERLAIVERRASEVASETGSLDEARADAAFLLYARMPEHVGTRALFEAWTRRAEREAQRGHTDRAIEAWSEAFTASVDDDGRRATLTQLAGAFAGRGEWTPLERVLARLEALGAGHLVNALRYRSAFFRGALDEARALADSDPTGPLAAALGQGFRLTRGYDHVQPFVWQGRDAFLARDYDQTHARLLDPARRLAEVGDMDQGTRRFVVAQGAPGWMFTRGDGDAEIWRFGDARPFLTLPLPQVYRAVGWLGADGAPRLVMGAAGGERKVIAVLPPRPGETSARLVEAPPSVAAPASDADDFARADFDGDGRPEIAVALGPWQAYDLRIFRADDDGTMTLLARRTVGSIAAMRVLPRRGAPPLIAVAKIDRYPSVTALGAAAPYAPPEGVYLYSFTGQRIEEVAYVPFPAWLGRTQDVPTMVVDDFDGDGLVDMALCIQQTNWNHTLFYRQVRPYEFAPVVRRNMAPLVAVELDGDPGRELMVRFDLDGRTESWVLGVAGERPPMIGSETAMVHEDRVIPGDDPELAQVWRGARTLADLGLLANAAAKLEAAAMLASSDAVEAAVLAEAAALHLERDDPHAAAPLFERALARAPIGDRSYLDALAGAARSWLAAVEPRRALERYRQLALLGDDARAKEARDTLAWLAPVVEATAPELALTFEGPIGAPLEVVAPESLEPAIGGGLLVRAWSDQDAIAQVPLTYDGGPVSVSVELELRHIEIGAAFVVGLRQVGAKVPWLGTSVDAFGGDLSVARSAACDITGARSRGIEGPRPIDAPPERIRIRTDYWPATAGHPARASCQVWRADLPAPAFHHSEELASALPIGPYELFIGARQAPNWVSASELRLDLERVDVTGLSPREVASRPLAEAHERFVNGDARGALETYRALGADVFALMAELEVASEPEVEARLGSLVGRWSSEPTLGHLLHIDRERLTPLLMRAEPDTFAATFGRVWGVAMRYTDAPEARAALLDPTLELLRGANAAELSLLVQRARLLLDLGQPERAAAAIDRVLAGPALDPAEASGVELLAARIAHHRGDRAGATGHLMRWRAGQPALDFALERLESQPDGPALRRYLAEKK